MSNKKCLKITSNDNETKEVYICIDDIKDITTKIYKEKREKKFKLIIECIFRNQVNRELYEEYSDYPGTAAIKLSKGKLNYRIYCKVEKCEIDGINVKRIVLSRLHHKKSQELSKKEINILKAIQNYEYEYKEWR